MEPKYTDYLNYSDVSSAGNAYLKALQAFYINDPSKAQSVYDNNSNQLINSYKQKNDGGGGNKGKSVIQTIAQVQGFTTGAGLVSESAAGELITTEKLAGALVAVGEAINSNKNKTQAFANLFKEGLFNLFEQSAKMIDNEVNLRNRLNAQIGIAGDLSRGYRDNIVDAYDKVQGMGYSFDELATAAISATNETGRFFTMNEKTMENMAVTSRAFIGDMESMGPILANFERVGVGAEKTLENINEAGKRALTLGLNIRTTTAEFQKNIGKINEYGFKNGIQGLADMVRKATEFRMSMDEAFKVADKVMSPEGAIDLAANLQVLGGAIGSLGDPFQMMYMATNNVEGLQDALIGAAQSLATYNTEQGRFEITGVNLRRAKAMAQELGISYQELAKGAIAAAERSSAAADLMTAGITVDEKQQEFITNLAKMGPGGKMTIEVPPSIAEKLGIERTQALEDLDQATADAILNNQKEFEKMNVKDIALNQFTETQKSALLLSEIAAMLKVEFARTYRGLGADVDSMIKVSNQAMEKFLSGESSDLDIKGQIDALRNKAGEDAKKQNMSATAVPQQPTNVNTNNQTNTQQNTQSTQQQKTQVDINIKSSNNLTDTLSREIMKDPTMFEDIFNKSSRDYLNPLGK
jgi:hypothetical protein